MMSRQRLTWQDGGDKAASQQVLPVEQARAASAHPATPDEGAAHPAAQPDPGEHDYENGDTSSWAEDPTTGPYPNSAHPETPDEGSAHPAAKEAARDLRAAVERKAAKCIRIATAMLGAGATVAAIEDQALDLMDMPDTAINATLNRLAEDEDEDDAEEEGKEASDETRSAADEALLRKLLAEEDEDEDEGKEASDEALLRRLLAEEDEDEDEGKEASVEKSALDQILEKLSGIDNRLSALETPKTAEDEDEDDDEALLANLLAEEEVVEAPEDDVESMLLSMLEEEIVIDEPEMIEEMIEDDDDDMDDDMTLDMGLTEDSMGLGDEDIMDEGDDDLLANLFADSRLAGDEDDDDEEEEEEVEEEEVEEEEVEEEEVEKEAKKANLKPRPKKASAGASRLGGVTKSADSSEIDELSKLWPSAPDVSKVFQG